MIKLSKQFSFQQFSSNSEQYQNLDTYGEYFYIQCKFTGLDVTSDKIKSQINYMKVMLNGNELFNVKPADLIQVMNYEGWGVSTDSLIIPFIRKKLDTWTQRSVSGLGCQGVTSLQLVIGTLTMSDITGCDVYVCRDDSINLPTGTIRSIIHQGLLSQIASNGQTDTQSLSTFGATSVVRRIHITSNVLPPQVDFWVNGSQVINRADKSALDELSSMGEFFPQTDYSTLEFNASRNFSGVNSSSGFFKLTTYYGNNETELTKFDLVYDVDMNAAVV